MENVSVALALSDYLPVLLYLAGALLIVRLLRGRDQKRLATMFGFGAALAGLSGVLKATSKLLDAAAGRPLTETGFLYDHMFPMMAVGFLATATATVMAARRYSGRDPAGGRTPFSAAASWAFPFAAGLFLGLAFGLVLAADYAAPGLRPHLADVKRATMIAMIVLQLATLGILSWSAFREGAAAAGVLAGLSVVFMLAMGALGSPGMQARFADKLLMNLIDQAVNLAAQGCFLGAAWLLWKRETAARTPVKR
jgi:hypothetical protein